MREATPPPPFDDGGVLLCGGSRVVLRTDRYEGR